MVEITNEEICMRVEKDNELLNMEDLALWMQYKVEYRKKANI